MAENLNLHQKLQKISELCDVLVKNTEAHNYKYVREEDVLAKVKAGFKKFRVNMYTQIVPDTMTVIPYTYEKYDKYLKGNKTMNEFIVQAQTLNTFINIDNPEEKLEVPFAMTASMDDPSLSMGSALSYSNRFFLLKFFQIPTTLEDPEQYRDKQRKAEDFDKEEAQRELITKIKEVVDMGKDLMATGTSKDEMFAVVATHNNGNNNPSSIETIEICDAVIAEFKKIKDKKKPKKVKEEEKTA